MSFEFNNFDRAQLRVKRRSLAAEARIIRNEEARAKARGQTGYGSVHASLYWHRIDVVRPESRAAHLAHAFLTGRPYSEVERWCRKENAPDFERVRRNALSFSGQRSADESFERCWSMWLAEAKAHLSKPREQRVKEVERASEKAA